MKSFNDKTQLNMVIGNPINQSRSPQLHQQCYELLGLNAILLPFSHPDLAALITSIKTLKVGLTAVTMPFKEQILAYLDIMSPEVVAIGAANTLLQKEGQLYGYNTDVDGIAYALQRLPLNNKKILIIGAGGAARAAGYYFSQHPSAASLEIYWVNRTASKAIEMAKNFGGKALEITAVSTLPPLDLIINATPIGMTERDLPSKKFLEPLVRLFRTNQTIFDMVYSSAKSPILARAASVSASIISGKTMLLGQAVRQIELWQGAPLRSSLLQKLSTETLFHELPRS